ncbi:MAG: hypothetical protein M3Z66_14055, partial [Chloroflexota bacterium]|nr:hypothetical protein [Chloroflexota bacterium]
PYPFPDSSKVTGAAQLRELRLFASVYRDWAAEQLQVYQESGEYELVAEYREALRRAHHKV